MDGCFDGDDHGDRAFDKDGAGIDLNSAAVIRSAGT